MTSSFGSFFVTRLTAGTTINPATIAMAPALIGESMKEKNRFRTVIPTPAANPAQTPALVTFFQYRP